MKRILALTIVPLALCADCGFAMVYSGAMYVVGRRASISLRAQPNASSTALPQIPRRAEGYREPCIVPSIKR